MIIPIREEVKSAMSNLCDKYREMTDEDFIDAVLSGDSDAEAGFQEIYINGIVRAKVRVKFPWLSSETEDICQEIWVYFKERNWRILQNYDALRDKAAGLRAYLCATVARFIAKRYRNKFGGFVIPLIFDENDETDPFQKIESPEPNPQRALENKDIGEKMENLTAMLFDEALKSNSAAALNEKELKIVRMRCVMGLHSKKVSEILEMSVSSVDTALSRAKKKIRYFYAAKGLLEEVREVLRDAAEL
jgi:RNA polymerase sigma factor (sigma-70 family)